MVKFCNLLCRYLYPMQHCAVDVYHLTRTNYYICYLSIMCPNFGIYKSYLRSSLCIMAQSYTSVNKISSRCLGGEKQFNVFGSESDSFNGNTHNYVLLLDILERHSFTNILSVMKHTYYYYYLIPCLLGFHQKKINLTQTPPT